LEVSAGNVISSDLEVFLEITGGRAITSNAASTGIVNGDAFLVISDNGVDSALFLIIHTANLADNTAPAANTLMAVKLMTFIGVGASEAADNTNFAFID